MTSRMNIILINDKKRKDSPCPNLMQGKNKKLKTSNKVAKIDQYENESESEV